MTLASDSQAVVERYLDEVLNGNGPASAEDLISNATFRQRVATFKKAFPDLAVSPTLMVADAEYVAVHLIGRATHRDIFHGVPATGRSWSATCSALYRIEAGRIADFWVNWDLLAILEQIGGVTRANAASA